MPSPKRHVPWAGPAPRPARASARGRSPGSRTGGSRPLRRRLAVERIAQELVHQLRLAHAGGRAVRAADRVLGGDVTAAVGLARVLTLLPHDLVRDATRVRELQPLRPEALHRLRADARGGQPVRPVADRLRRHRHVDRLRLVGPALAHPPGLPVREAREDRARVPHAVRVVEVVDRDLAVEEHRLLDALQPQRADMEVVVLLRATDAEGQVMTAVDGPRIRHERVSSRIVLPTDVLSADVQPRRPLRRHRLDGS